MVAKKLAIMTFILALAVFVVPGFAACDNACDTSNQYSCSLTTTTMAKSTSGTLTVAITNQQSQSVSSVATTLQGLGWFTGTTTTSTISSLNSGAATSIDYTVTPTSDGAQSICVRLGSECTADCGSITITSPAALSITSFTTSVSSVAASTAFTSSATIYNSGTETAGSSTSVTATLSGSGCTVTSGTKTIGTITGKESNSQSWTVTSGTGTCTLTLSVSGTAGGSDSSSATVTISTSSSNSSSSSSSGGSGGSNATSNATKETKLFSTTAGASKLLTFTTTTTGVTDIELKTVAAKTSIQVTIDTASKPSGASDPAIAVYKYMEISSTAANSDFSLIKIKFKVPKSWVTSNNVDVSTISLFRYNSGWNKLSTTQTSSDSSYYYYEATSPGFSTFAVAAEKGSATTPPAPETPSTPTPETPSTPSGPIESGTTPSAPGGITVPVGSTDSNTIIGAIILVLAIGFGILHHFFLKGGKYKYKPLKEVYSNSTKKEKSKYEYKKDKN